MRANERLLAGTLVFQGFMVSAAFTLGTSYLNSIGNQAGIFALFVSLSFYIGTLCRMRWEFAQENKVSQKAMDEMKVRHEEREERRRQEVIAMDHAQAQQSARRAMGRMSEQHPTFAEDFTRSFIENNPDSELARLVAKGKAADEGSK